MKFNDKTYRLSDTGRIEKTALVVGIIFLILSGVGYTQDSTQFFLSYLTSFFFWLTIALGGLFFTALHHITGAKWSIVLRKLSEAMAGTMPIFLILFIPLIFGLHDLYHWSHPEAVVSDEILTKKAAYLNTPFFLARAGIFFFVWILMSYLLGRKSAQQDKKHNDGITASFKKISAPTIILFALTITFASFDWLMSLDAHWFSTIFGVYIFSGSFLTFLCFLILVSAYLKKNGILGDLITVEHYHDVGKLLFGFIIFWAYMGFSQYFLIWYANLPEENYWFLYRWDNSWEAVGLLIIYGHFVFPFIALITRASKRSIGFLSFMAVWLMIMHFVEMYWLVMPTHYQDGIHFSIFDLAPLFGVGGLFIWMFIRRLKSQPLIPVNDPGLKTSVDFKNS